MVYLEATQPVQWWRSLKRRQEVKLLYEARLLEFTDLEYLIYIHNNNMFIRTSILPILKIFKQISLYNSSLIILNLHIK